MIRFLTRFGTLKLRLAVVVICLVLLAVALVTYVSQLVAERQMLDIVGKQQFALLSSAAAYIDEDLASKKVLLASVGEDLTLADYRPLMTLQEVLEAHSTLHDEFFNVIALDAKGTMIANLNDRRSIGTANFSKRDYFIDTVQNREGLISKPLKSTLSQHPIVVVTEPVFDQSGKLTYVLAGVIDLQRLKFFGKLDSIKLGETGYLFMLTKNGTIVHHPDQQRILQNVKDEAGGPVPSTLASMKGFEGWVEGKSKRGVASLIAYKHLRNTDWIVGAVYPSSEALAPIIEMGKRSLVAAAAVGTAAGIVGWLLVLRLLRPLGALQKHVARIFEGSSDIEVLDVDRQDEFGEMSRAFFLLSRQRRDAENRLVALARTDSLTGIPNRRMFEEVFEAALARADRVERQVALAYLDIDRFKQINDTYGHTAGDQILIEFAHRLKNVVRSTDTIARLAGDEFIILFEHLTSGAETDALAKKILRSMEPAFVFGDIALKVTTSIGIASNVDGRAHADQLMEAADAALYEAKSAGRNRYAVRNISVTEGAEKLVKPKAII